MMMVMMIGVMMMMLMLMMAMRLIMMMMKIRLIMMMYRVAEVGRLSASAKNAFNSFVGRVFANSRQKMLFFRLIPKSQQKW